MSCSWGEFIVIVGSFLRTINPRDTSGMGRTLCHGAGLFDFIGATAIVCWLVFMVFLLVRDGTPTAESSLELTSEDVAAGFRDGEEWHGIYHQDQKIGFVRMTRSTLDDGFRVEYMGVLRLMVLGTRHRVDIELNTEIDRAFVLTRFDGAFGSDASRIAVRGDVTAIEDGRHRIDYLLNTAGREQEGSLELDVPPMLQFDVRTALLRHSPEPGETFEHSFFDPLSQRQQTVVLEYLGREPLVVMGERVEAHHIVQHFGGQKLAAWINDLGEVLREELPLGLVGKRESRAEAVYGVLRGDGADSELVDLISETRIPVSQPPPDLTRIPRITWLLRGVEPGRFDLDGGRQTVTTEQDLVSVRLLREPEDRTYTLSSLPIPEAVAPMLEADPLVQSRDPAIEEQAREIAGDDIRVVTIAAAVCAWVHEEVTKESVIGVPSAVEVLDTRRGDCNEHATIATALLRSVGIPARIASGIAYLEGSFYYHAWVEYWHDGWRTADPTWGQFPADLGHIRLAAGGLGRQAVLMELFGHIAVEYSP